MGSENSHLHEFRIGGRSHGDPEFYELGEMLHEQEVALDEVPKPKGQKLASLYDCGAGVHEIASTARAYLPLAPINLNVNGDGHCPSCATGESVVVDWDMASPLRNPHPVEEDCASHFTDATRLQILDVATETMRWEGTFLTTGNATISNAAILAALGLRGRLHHPGLEPAGGPELHQPHSDQSDQAMSTID